MILVVGATGRLGGMITRRLLSAGHEVRILLRRNSPAAQLALEGMATAPESLLAAGAQPVYGDLTDPASLAAAVAGVRTVITTANTARRGEPDTLETVDRQGAMALIDASAAAGVGHFIYLSAIQEPYSEAFPLLAVKLEVEEYLMSSSLNYTILRPGQFMESWIHNVVVRPLLAGLPVSLPIHGRRRYAFVSIHDVAAYAVAAVEEPAALDQTITIAGPRSLSYLQVVETAKRVLGRQLDVEFIAPGQPHPLLGSEYGRVLTAMEAAPDTIVDMSETAGRYGIRPTSFEAVAADILAPLLSG